MQKDLMMREGEKQSALLLFPSSNFLFQLALYTCGLTLTLDHISINTHLKLL